MNKKNITVEASPGNKFYYIHDNHIRLVEVEKVEILIYRSTVEIKYHCKCTDGGFTCVIGATTKKYTSQEDAKVELAKRILGSGYKVEKTR